MSKLSRHLEHVDVLDKHFIGAITFRNEEITLPDGSKMALGIDDGHWVLIYQKAADTPLRVYKYNQHEKKIEVEEKAGSAKQIEEFKKHVNYFFSHAEVEDLVTLLPPGA